MGVISIIVPCYNEQESLLLFYKSISEVAYKMKPLDFEFIFVNDGSSDRTLQICRSLAEKDLRVKYISFSRNFGKESAMYAGIEKASGDFVAIMDADLQDPPSLLPQMYDILVGDGGYDCVATRRVTRSGEPPIRSFCARCFYKLINRISKTEIVDGARDFRLMTRQMVNAVLSMREYNRFSKGIFGWVGFRTKWLEYENIKRVAGETKWSFGKLFLYSLDGIAAFSTVPLAISSVLGFLFCIIALVMVVFYSLSTIFFGNTVSGFTTLICVILLLGGLQLFSIGILGQYLAKTYLEVKHRPIYIIEETNIK